MPKRRKKKHNGQPILKATPAPWLALLEEQQKDQLRDRLLTRQRRPEQKTSRYLDEDLDKTKPLA